jgi:spore coat protein H
MRPSAGANAVQSLAAALAAALAVLVGPACGGPGPTGEGPGDPRPPAPMVGWGGASVFGGGGVLSYDFALDPTALTQLIATAVAERYVPAALSVSGDPVGMVGLRFKGSDGTLTPCFENGQQICAKASFKVRFDFIDPSRRFISLTRLNFHSMIDDPSLMHERLNAKLFAEMGIVAPRVSHGEVTINGENKGVFAVVEEVDQVFAQDRWRPGGNGNLYKEAWPNDVDPDAYSDALETNQAQPNHSAMVAFAQGLKTAGPLELPGVLNHFADVDYLVRYLAVDRAIGNYDGFTTFYCDDQGHGCSNHNYYWYQAEDQARFWLIPWDLGDSLALQTPMDPLPDWDQPPADCAIRYRIEGAVFMPAACDPVFAAIRGAGRGSYLAALDRLLGVWDMPALYRQIEAWSAEIADAVARDTTLPGPVPWRASVRALKRDLLALRERIENSRDGNLPAPFGLTAPGLTDFEETTPLGFLLTSSSETNGKSGAVHDLNRRGPLAGGADARLDFELRNEGNDATTGDNSPWAFMTLPLSGPTDLQGLRRIRLRLVADNIRTVRLEIASPEYGDAEERYGWQLLASNTPEEYVVNVSALALGDGSQQGPVPIAKILSAISALVVTPDARGRSAAGLLPAGQSDVGFVQIDDIRFEVQ